MLSSKRARTKTTTPTRVVKRYTAGPSDQRMRGKLDFQVPSTNSPRQETSATLPHPAISSERRASSCLQRSERIILQSYSPGKQRHSVTSVSRPKPTVMSKLRMQGATEEQVPQSDAQYDNMSDPLLSGGEMDAMADDGREVWKMDGDSSVSLLSPRMERVAITSLEKEPDVKIAYRDELVLNEGLSSEEKEMVEPNDQWHLTSNEYTPPIRGKVPKQEMCVCRRKWCHKQSVSRWRQLGHFPPLRQISRHKYREVVQKHFDLDPSGAGRVNYAIRVHHYPIEKRHFAYAKGDEQFVHEEGYILPTSRAEDLDEEITMATAILKMNDMIYKSLIQCHLIGEGDGGLSLEALRDMYEDCLRDHIETKTNFLEDVSTAGLIQSAKSNGSLLISKMLRTMVGRGSIQPPPIIAEDEFLHSYLKPERIKPMHNIMKRPETVSVRVPHSIASRRTRSRPAKYDSSDDITIHMPTDAERLVNCLIPINEPPTGGKAQNYADKRLERKGFVNITAESQCKQITDYEMLKCYDKVTNQTVYIDVHGKLPKLAKKVKSPWNHAHYVLARDVITREELDRSLEICGEYNFEYLPPMLIFLSRLKGNLKREEEQENKLQHKIDKYTQDETVMGKVKEFEIFFERLLHFFIKHMHMLNVSDVTRLTWAYWNVWRTDLEVLFDDADRMDRENTRKQSGVKVCNEVRSNNMFLHYITTLLHTQGM